MSTCSQLSCPCQQYREDKESFGYGRYPMTPCGSPSSPLALYGSGDSKRLEQEASSIGSSLERSPRRSLFLGHEEYLAQVTTPTANSADPNLLPNMCGRKTPGLKERNLSSEPVRFELVSLPIGNLYGNLQRMATSAPSLPGFVWYLIAPSAQLLLTLMHLCPCSGPLLSFGVQPALGKAEEPGAKQAMIVILRIPEASFGVVTKVRRMLSSMNFAEVSTFPTSSGGPIATLFVWKSKDRQYLSLVNEFGLPAI